MDKAKKTEIIAKFARKEGDVGSPEVQVAVLTGRITELTEHMRSHRKDHATRKGLMDMVNKRKKLLKYLDRENKEKCVAISAALELRGQK